MARFIHTSRGKASSRPNPYNSTQSATFGPIPEPSAAPAAPLREEGMPRGRDREYPPPPVGQRPVCMRPATRSAAWTAPPRIRTRSVPVSERRNPLPQVLPEPAETADNALDPGTLLFWDRMNEISASNGSCRSTRIPRRKADAASHLAPHTAYEGAVNRLVIPVEIEVAPPEAFKQRPCDRPLLRPFDEQGLPLPADRGSGPSRNPR